MTKLDKIKEIIREYENGSDVSALDIICGIENVLDDSTFEEELCVDTPAGTLYAFLGADPDNKGIGIGLKVGDDVIDLCYAETKEEALLNQNYGETLEDVFVYNYDNVFSEEYTRETVIKGKDVSKALGLSDDKEAVTNEFDYDKEM